VGRLEVENKKLTALVEAMAKKQSEKDVSHKMQTLLAEHPELSVLKERLQEFATVAALTEEARRVLKQVHTPADEEPQQEEITEEAGRDAAQTASVSSATTPDAPTGPLTEDGGNVLDRLSETREDEESVFTRVKRHRQQQLRESQARASRLGSE